MSFHKLAASETAALLMMIALWRITEAAQVSLGSAELDSHRRHLSESEHQHQHHGLQLTNNLAIVRSISSRLPDSQGVYPTLSSFSCNGIKWQEHNRYGQPHARTCRFDNVCLNAATQVIEYFAGDDPAPLFYDQVGVAHHSFPGDFVNTGHVHIHPSHMDWAPLVLNRTFPAKATFLSTPVAAYASMNDFVGNFGHALFDFIFPVFNSMQIIGAYAPNFQLVFAEQQGGNPSAGQAFVTNSNEERRLMKLISDRPPITKEQLAASHNNTGLVCFKSLVAGTGSLQLTMARTRALPFRAAAFTNLGLADEPNLGEGKPLITVLKKKGRRGIENTEEIVEHLRAKFTTSDVQILDGDDVAVMPIAQQMEAMSKTSILITPCGGTGTMLMFLQPSATAIVMNFWQNARNISEQMENIYYWNLEYLDLEYFPVLPEDYEGTHDRPGCEKKLEDIHYKEQGQLIDCNIRIKHLKRLEDVVAASLRKWAITYGQPVPEGA